MCKRCSQWVYYIISGECLFWIHLEFENGSNMWFGTKHTIIFIYNASYGRFGGSGRDEGIEVLGEKLDVLYCIDQSISTCQELFNGAQSVIINENVEKL